MSTSMGSKIRKIRENEGFGRQAFSELIEIPKQTLINMEIGKSSPSGMHLRQICLKFPEYTLWLMNEPDESREIYKDWEVSGEYKKNLKSRIIEKNLQLESSFQNNKKRNYESSEENKDSVAFKVPPKDELEANVDLAIKIGDFEKLIQSLKDLVEERGISVSSIALGTSLKEEEVNCFFSLDKTEKEILSSMVFFKVLWFLRLKMFF